MKKKRVIQTKNVKLWRLLDSMAWAIPLGFLLLMIFGNYDAWKQEVDAVFADSTFTGILFLIMIGIIALIAAAPFVVIWRAVTSTIKRSVVKNTTFNVLQDLDYYRDRFENVSPADISMLTDLELEPRKDIAALILKYTMLGLVSTEHGRIQVLSTVHPDIGESDRYLLKAMADDRVDGSVVREWREKAKTEVVNKGYLEDIKRTGEGRQSGCGTASTIGCLCPILIILLCGTFAGTSSKFQDYSNTIDSLDDSMSNLEFIHYMMDSPEFTAQMVTSVTVAVLCVIALFLPLAGLLYLIARSISKKYYKRTALGQELTEEIYGMKNFIHDFSELSHADKEQLVLWDDFLIYAVLLEENTSIVDEICNMRHLARVHLPSGWQI